MINVLVTGGAGFIGNHLVAQLADSPSIGKVVVYDSLSYAAQQGAFERLLENKDNTGKVEFVLGDVRATDILLTCIQSHKIDIVVHLAAESHVDRSIYTPLAFAKLNVIGTTSVLEAVRLASINDSDRMVKMIYMSTDEVHGDSADSNTSFHLGSNLKPSSPYSASKAAGEMFVHAYRRTYGCQVAIVRCTNVFGPFQHAEKFVPKAINCIIRNDPIPVYGNGRQIREWIYVGHVAVQLRDLITTFNRGPIEDKFYCGQQEQNIDMVFKIAESVSVAMGILRRPIVHFIKDRPGHDRCYRVSESFDGTRRLTEKTGSGSFNIHLLNTAKHYFDLHQSRDSVCQTTAG